MPKIHSVFSVRISGLVASKPVNVVDLYPRAVRGLYDM